MNQPQTPLNIEQTFPLLQLNQLAEQEDHSTLKRGNPVTQTSEDSLDNKSIYEVQLLTDGGGKQDDRD